MPKLKIHSLLFLIFFSWVAQASTTWINGLHVKTHGDPANPALVFVHGGPGFNSFDFEVSSAQKLVDQGFFVVTYDQRGAGRSAMAMNFTELSFRAYAQDLKSIIDSLKIKKPTLIGHSFGGPIALKFMDYYPDIAGKTILAAAPVSMAQSFRAMMNRAIKLDLQPTWNIFEYQNKMLSMAQSQQIYHAFYGPGFPYGVHANGERFIPPNIIGLVFAQAWMNGTYSTQNPSPEEKEVRAELNNRHDTGTLGAMRQEAMPGFALNENYATIDLFASLRRHREKIFGIYGAEDGLFDQAQLNSIQEILPKGNFRLIQNASHHLYLDQRSEFIQTVSRFIKVPAKSCQAALAGN